MTTVFPDIVTKNKHGTPEQGFYMDKLAIQVCEAVVARVKDRKQDTLILFNGREGSGKTNGAVCLAYYMGRISGRTFTNKNIFFDLKEMMNFASSNKEQIILWDEGALGGLANDWTNNTQKKLNAFLMICRKLRHIFIFNIPRFYRLSPNIIERSHVMFHMFEDAQENPGNFIIIGQEGIENMYNQWKKTRFVNYFHFKKAPPGHFSFKMEYLIDNDAYEQAKSDAIAKLASIDLKPEKKEKTRDDFIVEGWEKNKMNKKVLSQEEFGKLFGISHTRLMEIVRESQETNPSGVGNLYNPSTKVPKCIEEGEVGEDYNDYIKEHPAVVDKPTTTNSIPGYTEVYQGISPNTIADDLKEQTT